MIVTAVTMLDMEDDPRSLADELIETGRDCIARFELEAATAETESGRKRRDLIYDDQLGSYHLDLHHAGRAHEHHRLILYAISAKNVRSKRKELGEVHTELK